MRMGEILFEAKSNMPEIKRIESYNDGESIDIVLSDGNKIQFIASGDYGYEADIDVYGLDKLNKEE